MGGKIDFYTDVASSYGYVAFADLMLNREALASYGVEIELHPILLGAIMAKTGNQPPVRTPAKAPYLSLDCARAAHRVHKPTLTFPSNFFAMARTMAPLRALHHLKQTSSPKDFISVFHFLLHAFWTPPHANISDPSVLRAVLAACPAHYDGEDVGPVSDGKGGVVASGGKKMFTDEEVNQLMKAIEDPEVKEALQMATDEALERGAFGAPWLWVTNEEGKAEPFFGSDRFGFVYKHLGIPYQDVAILPKL